MRAQFQPVRPFHNHDRALAENIFEAERLQIVKVTHAAKSHVDHSRFSFEFVNQRESESTLNSENKSYIGSPPFASSQVSTKALWSPSRSFQKVRNSCVPMDLPL